MKKQKAGTSVLLSFVALAMVTQAHEAAAGDQYYYYQRYLKKQQRAADAMSGMGFLMGLFDNAAPRAHNDSATQAYTYTQRVNWDDPKDGRTFQQRYYINSQYASGPDAPVFFYICGEAPCTGEEFSGATAAYAQKYHAHMVALEHRFYGKSVPLGSLSNEALAFLKSDYALKDLAAFQQHAIKQYGLTGKWIAVGGSYPGALSAFYRMKYPNLVAGSLASSGPVISKANFEEYDLDVATVAGPQCAATMRTVVAKLEASMSDANQFAQMKALFGAQDLKDPVDFLYVVADMGAIAIQYGFKDQFCQALASAPDPVQGYAQVGKQLFQWFGETPLSDSTQGVESTNPDDYLGSVGARSWYYQTCREFGYFQVAYHDPAVSVRSHLIDMTWQNAVCQRLFGLGPVQTDANNQNLYKPLLDPKTSNILFTNGSTDPWSKLGITDENKNTTNPNTEHFLIDGAAHCDDLGNLATTGAIKDAQDMFQSLLDSWLK